MKIIKLTKTNGKHVWINMDHIVMFQESGNNILVITSAGMGYRLVCPEAKAEPEANAEFQKVKKFIEGCVTFESKVIIE